MSVNRIMSVRSYGKGTVHKGTSSHLSSSSLSKLLVKSFYQLMTSAACAPCSHSLSVSLWICLALRFGGDGLLCNLISLIDPRRVVIQFFKLFLVERMEVMASKLFTDQS